MKKVSPTINSLISQDFVSIVGSIACSMQMFLLWLLLFYYFDRLVFTDVTSKVSNRSTDQSC